MLPNKPQETPTAHVPSAAAASNTLDRLAQSLTKNPKAIATVLAAVVLMTGLVWAGMAVSHARTRAAGFALTQAFAIKDALSNDLLAEREAARMEAKAQKLAQAPAAESAKDDGDDDGDDVRDDGDDDDDVTDEAQDASVPQFAEKSSRDAAALEAFAALAQKHPGTLGTLAALEAAALSPAVAGPAAPAPAPEAKAEATSPARAAQLLQAAAAPLPSHNPLLALASLREAQLAEDMGDSARALAACDRAIAAQQLFLGDEVRLVKARLLMGTNDLVGAQAALEDVQNNYPQSALADELRIQMAALKLLEAQGSASQAAPKAAVNAAG